MKKKVGFFGGSFDPIHFGHLSLAIQLREIHKLDEVLFCPALCSPLKMSAPPIASPEARLEMLRLCLSDIPGFQVTSIEIERKGPSYTVDTLRALQSEKTQFHLLLSEEAAAHFDAWREAEELLRLAPPLIGIREGARPPSKMGERGLTPTHVMEISSTEIRERLKKGLYCGHLVPQKALEYLLRHQLYRVS